MNDLIKPSTTTRFPWASMGPCCRWVQESAQTEPVLRPTGNGFLNLFYSGVLWTFSHFLQFLSRTIVIAFYRLQPKLCRRGSHWKQKQLSFGSSCEPTFQVSEPIYFWSKCSNVQNLVLKLEQNSFPVGGKGAREERERERWRASQINGGRKTVRLHSHVLLIETLCLCLSRSPSRSLSRSLSSSSSK